MISAGTARRNAGSAVKRRRYAGLAIDWASPLIESDRIDALAASARAIAGLRFEVPHQPSSGRMCRISPNHFHWNRETRTCRESRKERFDFYSRRRPAGSHRVPARDLRGAILAGFRPKTPHVGGALWYIGTGL